MRQDKIFSLIMLSGNWELQPKSSVPSFIINIIIMKSTGSRFLPGKRRLNIFKKNSEILEK